MNFSEPEWTPFGWQKPPGHEAVFQNVFGFAHNTRRNLQEQFQSRKPEPRPKEYKWMMQAERSRCRHTRPLTSDELRLFHKLVRVARQLPQAMRGRPRLPLSTTTKRSPRPPSPRRARGTSGAREWPRGYAGADFQRPRLASNCAPHAAPTPPRLLHELEAFVARGSRPNNIESQR
jgi:hypothetical protein